MVDGMLNQGINDPHPEHRLSLLRIVEAAGSIESTFLHTPQFVSETLSAELGCTLTLKVETANPIRSFKGRGADYFLKQLTERGDQRQLVCASTGNFGQAMAYACRQHDRQVIVYADTGANPLKLGRIRALGAEVRQIGADFDAAKDAARDFCAQTGSWMVEDGREPEISEGAGTIAVELLQDLTFDTILIPVGNGALINGVARWIKAVAPEVVVIGVSARTADAMERSWRTNRVVERESARTIAEGIAVRTPVPEAVSDMEPIVDEMLLVDDDRMLEAMRLTLAATGQLVEPAGAVGVAALLDLAERFVDERVATVLTGNNLSPEQMAVWFD